MNIASHITNHTTQVSGAVTIGSALSSKTAEYVASSTDTVPTEMIERANQIVISADTLAVCSFAVMLMSAVFNVWSQRKRDRIAIDSLRLRERELELKESEFNKTEVK